MMTMVTFTIVLLNSVPIRHPAGYHVQMDREG
jgi:hypothetical protein